jgi:hypothetical protein
MKEPTMEEVKFEIVKILKDTGRLGMDKLIKYLEEETDFFAAPASTVHHNNTDGGLARHSLNVYTILKQRIKDYDLENEITESSVAVCALMHDLCKANFYYLGERWVKDPNNKWMSVPAWKVKDHFPIGHGEKSVILLQRYINLTDEEIYAIRWHLGMSDAAVHFNYPSGFPYRDAVTRTPLVTLLQTADMEATMIMEKVEEVE